MFLRRSVLFLIVIALIGMALFVAGVNLYTDWLWFTDLKFEQVFLTILSTKILARLLIGLLFALFIYINLLFTRKKVVEFFNRRGSGMPYRVVGEEDFDSNRHWLTKHKINLIYLLSSVILGFLSSSVSLGAWEVIQKYLHRTPFGVLDPIFKKDVGFYVFELPFFQLIYDNLTGAVILTGTIVLLIYFIVNFRFGGKFNLFLPEKIHLAVLACMFLAIKAFGYLLQQYRLLYSPEGVVFGAGYTDVHVRLLAYRVLMVIVGVLALFTLINIFTRKLKLIVSGLIVWLIAAIVLSGICPGIVQKYRVEPNEVDLEKEYIQHSIDFTLKAYGLDKIEQRPFEVAPSLTLEDLNVAKTIVDNVRLWDWRPMQKTYSQLQEIRPYYDIQEVDIDRYYINGVYRQVMLAPRELNVTKLEQRAQTWINQSLKYTHGMGIVMSPVNEVTSEGIPELFIKNIPPVSTIDLKITQPRIYYGELTNNYAIVNNKDDEIDYTGVNNRYDGITGVKMNNIWRKTAFAIKFSNMNIMLSEVIDENSRVLFDRNILTRVKKITPFLNYDRDPYVVINEGKIYWIIDAYTTTNMYPYSEPLAPGLSNYIRNSVKAVVDAYNGTVDFYISDPTDPLILTYAKIFPGLFKSLDLMPAGLKVHIRYPEDIFNIQARVYSTYHMQNPITFFNKEDPWTIPNEKYAGETVPVQPYYTITHLPGEKEPEYILMLPYTPAKKNNLVSWLVARSDPKNFGELLVYTFPKDRTIYGPMMIEARIDQDPIISQTLTLWDQKGSSVIRGNLLTIPVKDSILYVEPVFLQSQQTQLPELKRVVVAFGDEVVMEETLQEALAKIFGIRLKTTPRSEKKPIVEQQQFLTDEFKPLADKAAELYNQAQQRLKAGDFAGYGETVNNLGEVLKRLQDLAGK